MMVVWCGDGGGFRAYRRADLCLCWVQLQGNVEAYGTINDMQARGIDTSKLLGVRRSDVILDDENIEDGSCCE